MDEKRNTDRKNKNSKQTIKENSKRFWNLTHAELTLTHTPVLHARVLPCGLLERDVAWGEGAKAASDDGHRAELGPGLVHHVGAGGALLAVVPIAPLQVVVRTGYGHLHGWASGEGSRARKHTEGKSTVGTDGAETACEGSLKSSIGQFFKISWFSVSSSFSQSVRSGSPVSF